MFKLQKERKEYYRIGEGSIIFGADTNPFKGIVSYDDDSMVKLLQLITKYDLTAKMVAVKTDDKWRLKFAMRVNNNLAISYKYSCHVLPF